MTPRKRPATTDRPSPKHRANGCSNPTADAQNYGIDRHEPLDAEDRAVARALAVLREHGYGIAMRCVDCQHPITTAASLRRMRGPRCAAKVAADE